MKFYDKYSGEWVIAGKQAVWRKGEDISDSGEIGEDYDEVHPLWAEQNLEYCFHCDCYVSKRDYDADKKKCVWCVKGV